MLLAAQKPLKTAGWWEVCFSWMPATGRGGCWARTPVERLTPLPLTVEMPELLQTAGVGGSRQKRHNQL